MAVTKRTQKGTFQRFWYTFGKQFTLSIPPILLSVAVTGVWYFLIQKNPLFWSLGFYIHEDETEKILMMPFVLAVFAYLFLGGLLWTESGQKQALVSALVKERSWREILKLRDERTPNHNFVFLGSLTFIIIGLALLTMWKHDVDGIITVSMVTFITMKFWTVVRKRDNPFLSLWVEERTPPELKTINIDNFFKLDGKLTDAERKELGLDVPPR